jgi:hypothetical protein
MARPIGFSTGSLAPGDIPRALSMLDGVSTSALELSSLRTAELGDLLANLDSPRLSGEGRVKWSYISVHAPSRFLGFSEQDVLHQLAPVFDRRWPVILHPDAICDWSLWGKWGSQVCIENMDSRKEFGKNLDDLIYVFDHLPNASFCFDIGHARQIDPTMEVARTMLIRFGQRLRQIHLSYVNADGSHEVLTPEVVDMYQNVAAHVSAETPIILETPVMGKEAMQEQVRLATVLFP